MHRATLVLFVKCAEHSDEYRQKEPFDKWVEKVYVGVRLTPVEELTDPPREYALDPIVLHTGKGDNVQYFVV